MMKTYIIFFDSPRRSVTVVKKMLRAVTRNRNNTLAHSSLTRCQKMSKNILNLLQYLYGYCHSRLPCYGAGRASVWNQLSLGNVATSWNDCRSQTVVITLKYYFCHSTPHSLNILTISSLITQLFIILHMFMILLF